MADTIERAYVQVHPSGEYYAVEFFQGSGHILGACGPLTQREVATVALDDYNYDPALGEWLMSEEFSASAGPNSFATVSDQQMSNLKAEYAPHA